MQDFVSATADLPALTSLLNILGLLVVGTLIYWVLRLLWMRVRPKNPALADELLARAQIAIGELRFADAMKDLRTADRLSPYEDAERWKEIRFHQARIFHSLGFWQQAKDHYQQAERPFERNLIPIQGNGDLDQALNDLHQRQNLQHTHEFFKTKLGHAHPKTGEALLALAEQEHLAGNVKQARLDGERATMILSESLGEDDPLTRAAQDFLNNASLS